MRLKKILIDLYNRLFEAPVESMPEISEPSALDSDDEPKKDGSFTYIGNRFSIELSGIPPYFFNSYKYLGTDVKVDKKWWHFNKKTIKDDYSIFNLNLTSTNDLDICEKLKELESSPYIGDIKIRLFDSLGKVVKTIEIPESQVVEIIAFRELDYQLDEELTGEIVVKHKQRKLS